VARRHQQADPRSNVFAIAVVMGIDESPRSCTRRGMQVNHKRVVRIMLEDNLLGLQPKRFRITTNSNHKFEVYRRVHPSS